jgi:hypothetical protein
MQDVLNEYERPNILTLEKFKAIEPGSVFNSEECFDTPEEVNMRGSGKKLRWVG